MLCRVEMPVNEQIFGRFYRWKIMHGKGDEGAASRGMLIFLPILAAILSFLLYFSGGNLILIAVVWLAILVLEVYSLAIRPGQIFRKKEGAALQTEVYIFTENGLTRSVRSEEGGMPDNISSQYDVLMQVAETKSDFYLFTSRSQAYLVDKAYFDKGTPAELSTLLKNKMGKKYIGKK